MTEKYIIATLFRLANQLLQLASVSISTDTDFENLPRTLLMSALPFYSPASCWIFITTLTIATSVILPLRFPLPAFLSTQLTARDAKRTYWAVNSQAQGVDSFLVPLSHALSYAQILRPPPKHVPSLANTQSYFQYLETLAGHLHCSRVHSVVVCFTGLGRTGTGGAHGFEGGRVVGGGWGGGGNCLGGK